MARRDYEPDHAGMGALLHGPEARQMLRTVAERAASYARAVAPRRTGRYSASIHVTTGTGFDGRPAADVVADVAYAESVEHDHHVLGRAGQIAEAG